MSLGVAAVVLFGFSSVAMASVSHYESLVPAQDIPAVSGYQTDGADMAGMKVTVFFSDGTNESAIWQATGANSGEAKGKNWVMSEAGDTFVSPWSLTYQYNGGILLTGFQIDGFAAGPGEVGVMFDRTFPDALGNPQNGTPGSYLGRDLELVAPVPFDVEVTYIGAIGVAGADPVGDEFRWLNARFANVGGIIDEFTTAPPTVAGLDGENIRAFEFRQDSNNPIVPEPATIALLSLGGLVLMRRWL
jgi:hypothetical protein